MTFPEHSGFVCLFFYFHFKNRVSCSSGWILTCLALQNDFELLLCVPLPPKNWDAGMHHHGGPHRMLWHLLLIWSFPDSFPYCLAFPLIFFAVIVLSSWLSYVPLGYLFILKQQFLGTSMTLFKSFFFVVGDASSSEYVFGDMMPLISCNLRSHDFDSPLQYWVHRGDATEPPANCGNQVHKWLQVLWRSPTHFFPPMSYIWQILIASLKGDCRGSTVIEVLYIQC